MPVGNLGPNEVVTASRDTELGEIVETFESENVGAVVIAEDDEPVGIVTDRDAALAVGRSDDVASLPAEEVMTADPVTLREDEEGMEISRTIDEHDVRRIPVVDENGELTGIVTVDDLVATIGEQLDHVADTIEVQSPEYRP
jgi:CBS domain-containing protein